MSMGSKYRVEEIVPYLRLATWDSEEPFILYEYSATDFAFQTLRTLACVFG
jgi:hypothetical protein